MKVVIAGGGVVGCAIAYYLAKAGADVTVLERGDIGQEASAASAGMLVAPFEDLGPRPMVNLQRQSRKMYARLLDQLEDESGIDIEYRNSGLLRTAFSEKRAAELRALIKRRTRPEAPVQWLDGAEVRKLEPALSEAVLGAAYSPKDGQLNAEQLTRAFARAAGSFGADVRRRVLLTGFVTRGHKLTGVTSSSGEITGVDAIVLAAGPWTRDLAARLSCTVPTPPVRGQMIAYRSDRIRHVVWGEDGYLVPKPRGILYCGATVEDVGFRKSTTKDGLAHLRNTAGRLVPALRRLKGARAWAGLRPGSPDGLPIMGKLPKRDNVYVATGHFRNGILLAPVTGKLMSELILTGKPSVPLDPFSPLRFAS